MTSRSYTTEEGNRAKKETKERLDRRWVKYAEIREMYSSAQCGRLPEIVISPAVVPAEFPFNGTAVAKGGNKTHLQLALAVVEALHEPLNFIWSPLSKVEISYRGEEDGQSESYWVSLRVRLHIRAQGHQGECEERLRKRLGEIFEVDAYHKMEHTTLLDKKNPPDISKMAQQVAEETVGALRKWLVRYHERLGDELRIDTEAIEPITEHFFGKRKM